MNILAAVANDGTVNGPNLVALYNGTSMATPHTTGSGALLMGLHTDWTPSETKSALMMTAKEDDLTEPNGTTPATPFDRGAGRLQDFQASHAGLVLNETGLNFADADPSVNGALPVSSLNIASMQSSACVDPGAASGSATCTFVRHFRSTQDHAVTYTASFSGVSAVATPATFPAPAHANVQPISITVDATSLASDHQFHFGEMLLTPSDTTLPTLHLPIAVKVPPPSIAVSPSAQTITIPHGSTTSTGEVDVTNTGGPTLNVTNTNYTDATVENAFIVIDQVSGGSNGWYSTYFPDFSNGYFASDDFTVSDVSTNLSKIQTPGFGVGTTLSAHAGAGMHFRIYPDAGGVPASDPLTDASNSVSVWHYDTTIGAAGLSVAGDTITLDLTTAAASATALPPRQVLARRISGH